MTPMLQRQCSTTRRCFTHATRPSAQHRATARPPVAPASLRHPAAPASWQTPQRLRKLHAANDEASKDDDALELLSTSRPALTSNQQSTNMFTSIGLAAVYIGLVGYAFLLSPNQTPARDAYFLQKVLNLTQDSYHLPAVWWSLFNIMGVYPAIYAQLLIPTGRSDNKVPAWPFVAGSFFAGAFAIIPYFILWQPERSPPPPKELPPLQKFAATAVPAALLVAAVGLWGNALAAGPEGWNEYFHLFDESKLTHVTTLDFLTLTALAPFWMLHDAQVRAWEPRDKLVPILSFLPVVGPALYLLLRPKTH